MSKRRPRSDDILFLSALAAILVGLGFLLYTTRIIVGVPRAWPLLLMTAGGALLYFAVVRGISLSFFFGGMLLVLEGAFLLATALLDWKIAKAWPLGMAIAGVSGLISGLVAKKRLKAFFAVPSIGFTLLGAIFSIFSFGLARVNFKSFISVWWPTLLIAGGVSLFLVYGFSRRSSKGRAEVAETRTKRRAKPTVDRLERDRGPSSGP